MQMSDIILWMSNVDEDKIHDEFAIILSTVRSWSFMQIPRVNASQTSIYILFRLKLGRIMSLRKSARDFHSIDLNEVALIMLCINRFRLSLSIFW
jgi:hypothetical protein